jgi:hypothetical protein
MTEPVAEMPRMGDYGVGGPDWRPLSWSWAVERIKSYHNYWLVTADGTGRPHALPVWGVWGEEENRFGFSCAHGSRKAANLRQNPQITIAGDSTVEAVSVEGVAREISGSSELEPWIVRYLAKYKSGTDVDLLRTEAFFEVVPERAFAVIERDPEFSTRATRWRFGNG